MMTSNVMVWIRERLGGATEVTASTKVEVSSFAEDSRMESCMTSKGVAPTRWRAGTIASAMAVMACMWAVTPVSAGGADCVVADNGTGTVTLPPEGCAYLSPTEFHMIVDGLPPGTEIILEPIHRNFLCKQGSLPSEFCENPGGNLGGFIETFDSDVQFQATGTGALAGFNRIIDIPNVFCETHTGPRTPGDPVQTFDNEMVFLQGQLFGDPDFDQLLITAGTNNGLPSSGQTTLTQLGPPGSDFQVDSFFDIEYRIDFMGAPGGALGGMGGSTTGIVRVEAFGDPVICPLPPTEDWCAGLQTTQCVTGTDSDLCLPELVIVNQPGDIFVELCNCFDGETCGPVSITPDGELFRCPGECPAGAGQCEIHIDGNPTGQPDIPVSAVPPGSTVTCECGPGTDVCEPTPDGLACTNAVCPDPTAEQCQPKCANFNPLTGETKVTECDCVGFDDCHVVVGTAGTDPFCQGACPVNTVCEENLVTLPDGTVDICCDCVPVVQGACCVQLSCFITTAADCDAQSGSYQGDNTVCGPLEACCLADGSCADTPRACCIDFGGMPQGPGTTCADTVCGPNDCQPTADQQDCEPFICPDDPNGIVQDCQKKCIERDLDTGAIYVTDCECTGFDECHAELLTPGGPGTAGGVAGGPGADPCIVADNGTGTVTLPPAGCAYLSAEEVHMIIDGLPAGTTIELEPIHKDFICAKGAQSCSLPIPPGDCETTGGDLGGNLDCFDSILELQVTGNGPGLPPGYSRFLTVPLFTEVHTGPRTPGDAVQDFDNQMFRIEGELFGDPDFCTLRIRGGVDNGLASSGHTTLTELPSGDFYVDSFFDITYQIEFQGCPGSPLDGYAGTTEATIRMQTGGKPVCVGQCPPGEDCEETTVLNHVCEGGVNDGQPCDAASECPNGICATRVSTCCDCVPVVEGACCVQLSCFVTTPADCAAQGGSYQGDGTVCGPLEACCLADGSCADTPRACCIDFGGMPQGPGTTCADTVCGPTDCEPNADQSDCEPFICPDDPTGIVQECLKKCIERDLETGEVYVTDCDCVGIDDCHAELLTPNGPGTAGGVAGGAGADPCIVADNGTGTVTLPPAGCAYLSADEVHMIIDGLPAGTTIELEPIHKDFICAKGAQSCSLPIPPGDCETTGGDLGGNLDCFDSILELQVTGNGPGLPPGYSRFLTVPLFTEVHTGPRTPGDAVQDFDNQMFRIEGELFGDPDFCTLRIRGGVDNGLASSGHTTLTELPSGDFYVDSFFDITYQIEFQGCPGSPLDGYAGTTEATIRMQTGGKPVCVGQCPPGEDCLETTVLNHVCEGGVNDGQPCDVAADCPNGFCSTRVSTCCDCLPVEEACCLPDGSCAVLPPADCAGLQGTPQGPGAVCGGALEACCITDADGNVFCQDVDPLCCVNVYGGVPGGAGSSCSSETGSCCFDADGDGIEESCAVMNQFCCEAQNGTFTAGGVCQGDADNNGIDDACEEPDFCPLPNAPFVPICEQNLSQCQDGDDTQRCLPRLLIAQNNGQIFPELCECFNQTDECGPVSVRDVPGTPFFELSCEGICPPGEDCLIHLNGQSAGTPVITSDVIGAGTAVTCECDSGCPVADQPQAENKLGQACVTDADCSNLSVCRNGGCYVPKNKYISVRPGNIGQVVGLRVTMTQNNLFPALVGSQWWVQPHVATDPPEVYRLGCTKHYQDWATAPVVIQIADIHITTDAEYAVQALTEGCDQTDPNNFSPPILLPTVRLWGDCCGSSVAGVIQPPDGFVNFTDIQAAILGFQNAVNAPNDSWVDIDPNFPNAIVNLADVFRFVQAFQGAPYPYAGPVPCP